MALEDVYSDTLPKATVKVDQDIEVGQNMRLAF